MRSIIFAISLLASYAAALSPGIYGEDGKVINSHTSRGLTDVEALELAARNALPESIPATMPTRRQHSNAYRLRNGLPLLPPTKRSGALAPRTSCLPLTNNVGTISVTSISTSTVIGFISNVFDSQNSYTYTSNSANILTVSLPSFTPFGSQIDITAVNGPDSGHSLIGGVGGSGGYYFSNSQSGYAYLSGVGHTDANSPPSSTAGNSIQVLGYNAPSESQIWTINCATLEITAQWTNTDSTESPSQILYDPVTNYLALTSDLGLYNSIYGDGASAVKFTFVPSPI